MRRIRSRSSTRKRRERMGTGRRRSQICQKETKFYSTGSEATRKQTGKHLDTSLIQSLFSNSRHANAGPCRLHIATEYQGGAAPTADTQHYYNITLRLKEAEPGVGSKYTVTPKSVTATKPYTKDEGLTWHIDHIELPPGKKGENVKALADVESWRR
jgi:hypothetical protein